MKSEIEIVLDETSILQPKDKIFDEILYLIEKSKTNRLILILPLDEIDFYSFYYLFSLKKSFESKSIIKQLPSKGDRCYIEPFTEVFIFHDYTEDYIEQMEGTGVNPYIKRIYLSDINSKEIFMHMLNDKNKIIKTERSTPKGNSKYPLFKDSNVKNKFQEIFTRDENLDFENLNHENVLILNRNEKNKHLNFINKAIFLENNNKSVCINEFPISFINKQKKRVLYKNKSQEFNNPTVFEFTSSLSNLNLSNSSQTLFTNNISLLVDKDSWVERFSEKNKIIVFVHPNKINQINLIKKQNFNILLFGNDKKTNEIIVNSNTVFDSKIADRINSFKDFDYQFAKFHDTDFDNICNIYFELTKHIKSIDDYEREILSKIRSLLFKSNELIFIQNQNNYENANQANKILNNTLEINKFDLDSNKYASYEKIYILFKNYLNKDEFFENKKTEIEEYLKLNPINTLVIIPENEFYKEYLRKSFPNCTYLSLRNFISQIPHLNSFDLILVCCYVKKDFLHKVVFSQVSKKIIFVCNNFEHNHYNNYFSKKAWLEIVKFDSSPEKKLEIFGEEYETIESKDHASNILDDDKMRIVNLDEYLDRPIFDISNHNEEKIIPVLAKFQCGGMAYLYENHDYQIIHQDKDDTFETSKTNSSNLQYDDIIIIRNTGDKEIYEEESKRATEGEEYQELSKVASKWKEMLKNKFNSGQGYDTDYILSQLNSAGFKKHRVTLQNWLYGNVRCPDDLSDLILINKICDEPCNQNEIKEIFNAAQIINSIHQRVGKEFSKRMLDQIEKLLNENLLIIEDERIRVDIDREGNVRLGGDNSDNPEGWVLKIESINTVKFAVPHSHLNRLYIP